MINFTVEDVQDMEANLTEAIAVVSWAAEVGDETDDLSFVVGLLVGMRNALHDRYCEGCE